MIKNEVSGKALTKDASNASKLLNKVSPTGGDDDDDDLNDNDPWL